MAARRMLSREVATSERLNGCSERADLAYCKALPFTCRDGRVPGSARKLRALCFPMRDWTIKEVEEVIRELTEAGLWLLYTEPGPRQVIEVVKFHVHQPGVRPGSARYNAEAPSPYAAPTQVRVATDTGATQVRVLKERKGTKEKGKATDPTAEGGGPWNLGEPTEEESDPP